MKHHLIVFTVFTAFFFGQYAVQAQVKIGDNVEEISPYALLELESNSKGLIIPRMSTQERDNAFDQSTPAGMMIFNIDQGRMQFFREARDQSGRKTGYKIWEEPKEGIDVVAQGENPPQDPVMGQLYYDTSSNQLKLWNGLQWINITTTPMETSGNVQSLTLSQTILSISEGNSVDLAALLTTGPQGPIGPEGPQGIPGTTTNTDSQTLVASALSAGSTMTLAISEGNTITLDFSTLSGGGSSVASQTLTASALSAGNTMTLAISDGNTVTLDFSTFSTTDTDSQTLTASALSAGSTMTVAISEGNTVTLDLSALDNSGTDSQTLTASALSAGSTMTVAISEGNTVTLDLSALDNSGTDSQTLSASALSAGSTMTVAISEGNTVTLDLSALDNSGTDSQTLSASALSAGSTMTVAISEGNTVTLDLSALDNSGTDSQTLTASALSAGSTMTVAISEGNTVTLDLSALDNSGTDSQTLSASALSAGSTMTMAISEGNTVTLDLSALDNSGTDSQTLTASALSAGSTMTVAISEGNTVTLDLSALDNSGTDSQTLSASALSAGSTMTVAISEGNTVTLDLSALDNSGTDSQTLTASALSAGSTMTVAISEGNTVTLDLSALDNSGTDSQTLAFDTASTTSTKTVMTLENSQSITLTASGSLSISTPNSITFELKDDTTLLTDGDGDTLVQVEEGTDDDTIRFDTAGTERMTITSSGTIGIAGPADVEHLRINGSFANTGGGRFTLQGGQNGGTGRGIHLWDFSSNTHGLYFGTAGAGKSFSGGNATAGAGFNSHSLRIRIFDSNSNGVIFENSNEDLLASIRSGDGLAYFAGNVGVGIQNPSSTLSVSGTVQISNLSSGTSVDQVVTADSDGNLRKLSLREVGDGDAWGVSYENTISSIGRSGNVGIGIDHPKYPLHIKTKELAASTNAQLTSVPNDGTWVTIISDVSNLDNIHPENLSFSSSGFLSPPTHNFDDINTNAPSPVTKGIVVSDETVLIDDVRAAYWFYGNENNLLKAVKVEFRLNGTALEVREQSARYRNDAGSPAVVSIENQTENYFSGTGWNAGGYRLDQIIVSSQAVVGNSVDALVVSNGSVGIGNSTPNASAILDLSNTSSSVLLLPDVAPSAVSTATEGMLSYDSSANNAYLNTDGVWRPITFNTVSNELIFDGKDDSSGLYDDYYYISLIESGAWKVVRYHKTDPNDEATADNSTNSSVTSQPTLLSDCIALTF